MNPKTILIITLAFLTLTTCQSKTVEKQKTHKLAPIEKGRIEVVVASSGTVEPVKVVEIKSKASGEILRFPSEEGDAVDAGTLLIELDNAEELRSVMQATAAVTIANATLINAVCELAIENTAFVTGMADAVSANESATSDAHAWKLKFEAAGKLLEAGNTSPEEFETVKADYEKSLSRLTAARSVLARRKQAKIRLKQRRAEIMRFQAELTRARVELERAEERLADTRIHSPLGGILLEKFVEENQIISSGISTTTGGTALCTVADVSALFVIADVDESDVGRVAVGRKVRLAVDAFPKKRFEGVVERIAPKGFEEASVTVFRVKVRVLGEGAKFLRPNMTASAEIIAAAKEDAVLAPAEAIKRNPETGKTGVYTLEGGKPVFHEVKLGLDNGYVTEITTDLPVGTKVITSPLFSTGSGKGGMPGGRGMHMMRRSMGKKKGGK
jgi:HlyD family secretion protein